MGSQGKDNRLDQTGFTLLELMVVIAIIGILAAIAIPNFLTFRQSGYRASVHSDLKTAFKAGQVYFSINPEGVIADPSDLNVGGYIPTDDVTLTVVNGSQVSFELQAYHEASPAKTSSIDHLGMIHDN